MVHTFFEEQPEPCAVAFAILSLFRVIWDKDAGSVRKYFSMMIFLLSLLFFMSLYYWNLVGWKFKVELWS